MHRPHEHGDSHRKTLHGFAGYVLVARDPPACLIVSGSSITLGDKKLYACDQTRAITARLVADGDTALVLFTESLDVRFAIRIEEFLAAMLPSRFEFGRRNVPVWPAFLGNGAQVLAEIFQSGPAEEPVAVVDLVNDKTRLEDNHVGDHGIVGGIGVFGDVEIFLDDSPRVGEKRPVGADAGAIFIRLGDVVRADGDKAAIGNLEFVMELNKQFGLAAVLGAETSAAEDENHGMWPLQFGELPAFCGVIGKLVVGEDSPRNNVRSHRKSSTLWMRLARLRRNV
jgi:hypothetical protein